MQEKKLLLHFVLKPLYPLMPQLLDQDIKYLKGVGPVKAETLQKELGIVSYRDLLYYYPYKYVDRSRIYYICEINGSMPYVQLKGQILSFETSGSGGKTRLIAHFADRTGVIDLIWFQGIKYVKKNYDCRVTYIVFGRPTVFNGRIQITHPDIDPVENNNMPTEEQIEFDGDFMVPHHITSAQSSPYGKLVPNYITTERMKNCGLNSDGMAKLTERMLKLLQNPLEDTLPAYLIDRNKLISLDEALRNIHFPQNPQVLEQAQTRLKFEELFYVQLHILRYARERIQKFRGFVFPKVGEAFNTFYHQHLAFPLTGAQKRVVKEIREDMRSGRQMNRLLQGDVGSGKTLVALLCSLLATDNGYQTCIMAPTEILAEQHLDTIRSMVDGMGLRVELLTGIVKGKKRATLLEDLVTGKIHILIGTHAVIEDNVVFSRLGLVIIDEQHRFGVAQRAKMWKKNTVPPHVLVMTATPIPRTLAMTLYGDLDVSVIDELPPGRKPIQTVHQFDNKRDNLNAFMLQELKKGRQIYIVYPLIEESEKIDLKNLEDGFEQVCHDFRGYQVSKVHGRMKPAEKDAEMQRFATGETKILVATTVIEVGVNVPNASVMVIENAERFGLSQLHQLRGRVGRGAEQSYCVLVTKYKLTEESKKRIKIMVDSNDGFEIAEMDLKLRGPGDLEGTQQSGMAFDLKIANIARDGQLLMRAREEAQKVIADDENENNPANEIIWRRLKELRKSNGSWGAIS